MPSRDEAIEFLKGKEKELKEKLEFLRKPMIQVEQDLKNIAGAIEVCERNVGAKYADLIAESMIGEATPIPISRLRGLTQLAAVVAIAKFNGGIVRAQDAKRLMIKAGIMMQTKNSTNMTHNVILRSDQFERIEPGVFKLKETTKSPIGDGGDHPSAELFRPVQ